MVRTALFPLLAAAALAPAAAMANTCEGACTVAVDQIGYTSISAVAQSGPSNTAAVTQGGPGYDAVALSQDASGLGAGNSASIAQSGAASNRFTGLQSGSTNRMTVVQAATTDADTAVIDQIGVGNTANVYQNYNPNSGTYGVGGNNYAYVYQGANLYGAVSSQATIQQQGRNDVAVIAQYGAQDSATAIQTGSNDSQSITQFGNHDTAAYSQLGNNLGDVGIKQTGNFMAVSVAQTPASVIAATSSFK